MQFIYVVGSVNTKISLQTFCKNICTKGCNLNHCCSYLKKNLISIRALEISVGAAMCALNQESATPGTRAKYGTRADFLWHTK